MNTNNTQKFYCYNCNKETLGVLTDIQTSHGINQCIICTNCFSVISLSLLDRINRKVDELKRQTAKIEIDSTTKFARDSKEYNDYYYPKIDKKGMHR
ncbi:unknown [Firmicutes bacterium CAG:460]|nr:unknown [Firmicutes bacterium CAG:460]